jgi:hypothetical protein
MRLLHAVRHCCAFRSIHHQTTIEQAAQITGLKPADISKAAEWIAQPKQGGARRRTMFVQYLLRLADLTQIVSASLADVGGGLSAGADELAWVQTSYLVAEIVVIPLSGWLSRWRSISTTLA